MRFDDRYSSAVRSSNLKSKPDTTASDPDVLGAAGLASAQSPLALALLRLLMGDNYSAKHIVNILGASAVGKAYRMKMTITPVECTDMARMVLAWFRHGVCRPCNGHGYELIDGAPSLSGHTCKRCRGTGKILFDRQFKGTRLELARWMLAEVEREVAIAGPLAMSKLAPKMDFTL